MAHIKAKYFPTLLMFSAVIVEACAAFFSVYGLTKLFAGAALAVGIMAGSLEFAKVISASYLYRYWDELGKSFKTYLTSAVVILMLITSLGIYGFLSNAFQSSTLGLEKEIAKLTLQEQEIERIKEDSETLKSEKLELQRFKSEELNGLIVKEETRFVDVNKRASVSKKYDAQIKEKDVQIVENNKKIEQLSQSITDAKVTMIDTGADIGPIIFVSKAFGIDVSTTVQYLIFLFIVVFDPLALALIIAFNKISIENHVIEEKEQSIPNYSKYQKMFDELVSRSSKTEEVPQSIKEQPVAEPPKPEEPSRPNWPQPRQTSSF